MKRPRFFGWILVLVLLAALGGAVSASTVAPIWSDTSIDDTDHTSPPKQPVPFCGNDTTEPGEACDGADLNGYDCSTVMTGFTGGTLACRFDCSVYDVSQCVSGGNTIQVDSCNRGDVLAAIQAASDGDTVAIPAGTCTWTSTMVIDPMPGIILQGAGIDQTIITNEVPRTGWLDSPMWITSEEGKPFRITGLTFQGSHDGTGNGDNGTIRLGGTCKNWRIDHVKFYHLYSRAVRTSGYTFGVIDHCEFVDMNTQSLYIDHSSWGGHSYGDGSWASPLSLGTGQAIYIEDNTFTWTSLDNPFGVVDACGGARYVFRHNTVERTGLGNHGTESTGRYRSCFSYEIYNNTFTRSITPGRWTIFHNRGGTGVIFNNTIVGNYNSLSHVNVYREFHDFSPWGACDGTSPYDVNDGVTYESGTHTGGNGDSVLIDATKNWTPDQWFGYSVHNTTMQKSSVIMSNTENTITYKGDPYADDLTWDTGDSYIILRCYPCIDQVGRSAGNLLSNPDPPLPEEWPDQDLEPFYEWNNTINGEDTDIVSDSPHLLEGRDYHNDTQRPGYRSYVYPHPLAREDLPLVLQGSPGNRTIYLSWTVNARLPTTSTWQIDYEGPVGDQPPPITGIVSPTRAYPLTGLTNYIWYTVTLHAMLDSTPWLTDTVRVMPTDIAIYLPLAWRMR